MKTSMAFARWLGLRSLPALLSLALVACGGGGSSGSSLGGGGGSGGGGTTGTPGTIGFSASTDVATANGVVATQASGTATLTVTRTGGTAGAVSVTYSMKDGSAVAGTDYTSSTGTLNWADGVGTAQSITIPLSTTTPFYASRTFTVSLGTPTGGASSGTMSSVVAINGSATATAANQVGVVMDAGPSVTGSTNTALNIVYTTVQLCAPSGSPCDTIDHVQVDTGSVGLRVLADALTGKKIASSNFTQVTIGGVPLVECQQFADGYSWGPVKLANVTIGGETASNVPLQVIGDPQFDASNLIPSACSSLVNVEENTVATFGANAILGIGNWLQDCGNSCPTDGSTYSTCTTSAPVTCTPVSVPVASQVPNPVTAFAVDNNGILLQLPTVPLAGAVNPTGTLTFGIGTQANNAVPNGALVYKLDPNYGTFTSTYSGQTFTQSFIDSGSNGYFFTDKSIATCTDATYFFCPTSTLSESATIATANQPTLTVPFTVTNFDQLSATATAAPGIAGPAGTVEAKAFDWGIGFFFGRPVYIGIEGNSIKGVTGPVGGDGVSGPLDAF